MSDGVWEVRTFWCTDCQAGMQRPFPQGSFFIHVEHACLGGEAGWKIHEESPGA